jgi:hypothetical protein
MYVCMYVCTAGLLALKRAGCRGVLRYVTLLFFTAFGSPEAGDWNSRCEMVFLEGV